MAASFQVQVGLDDHVPVLELDTTLKYVVYGETFPKRRWARFTAS